MPVQTNRDLYLAVMAELGRRNAYVRPLKDYLLALRADLLRHREAPSLAADDFVIALSAAFETDVEPIDTDCWRSEDLHIGEAPGPITVVSVDRILRSQILDLEDAHAAGLDRAEYRNFGLEIPRQGRRERATGSHWFNWDPLGYVECGIVGTFGGWEPHDPGGRELVPGLVAVEGPDGEITSMAAEEIERPVRPIDEITWSDVADFLWAGQNYE